MGICSPPDYLGFNEKSLQEDKVAYFSFPVWQFIFSYIFLLEFIEYFVEEQLALLLDDIFPIYTFSGE